MRCVWLPGTRMLPHPGPRRTPCGLTDTRWLRRTALDQFFSLSAK